jgi:hypothetical protein
MNFLTHILFIGVLLLYGILVLISYPKPPAYGGDQSIGYAYALVFLGCILVVTSLALFITLHTTGRFKWVPFAEAGMAGPLIYFYWATFVATTLACVIFRWENHPEAPLLVRKLADWHGLLWLPLGTLVPLYFHLSKKNWLRPLPSPIPTLCIFHLA